MNKEEKIRKLEKIEKLESRLKTVQGLLNEAQAFIKVLESEVENIEMELKKLE